ncbi:MAG TPA: hypothetical protein VHV78_02480 [Gemmatimonadaceae bacterium]|nr:hypothetical protein [Gemmatimonadaceae bacterium]
MASRKKAKKNAKHSTGDLMHGRSFAGVQWAADENEQTRDIERANGTRLDQSDEFVTDAELEAREARGRGKKS